MRHYSDTSAFFLTLTVPNPGATSATTTYCQLTHNRESHYRIPYFTRYNGRIASLSYTTSSLQFKHADIYLALAPRQHPA